MIDLKLEYRAEQAQRALDNLEEMDLVTLHADLGEEARNIIEERFDKGVDPKGKKWKKIKPYFNRDHNRLRVPSDPPLKIRDLYRSFSYDASQNEVIIGTPKKYAKYHTNFPSNNGARRRRIPLREFMGYESPQDINRLLGVVEDHIELTANK